MRDDIGSYWTIPLTSIIDAAAAAALCDKPHVTPRDIPPALSRFITDAGFVEGDHLVFLIDGHIRAVGHLLQDRPGRQSLQQRRVDLVPDTPFSPSKPQRLSDKERNHLRSHLPLNPSSLPDAPATPTPPTHPSATPAAPLPHASAPPDETWLDPSTHASPDASVTAAAPLRDAEPAPTLTTSNIILYGPPGTGKTHEAILRALTLILGERVRSMTASEQRAHLLRLQREGQIELVTFHASYSYEDFVEGIRPVLGGRGQLHYDMHEGVLKRAALRAAAAGLKGATEDFEVLWSLLTCEEREDTFIPGASPGHLHQLKLTADGQPLLLTYAIDDDGVISRSETPAQVIARASLEWLWRHRRRLGATEAQATVDSVRVLVRQERPLRALPPLPVLRAAYLALLMVAQESSRGSKTRAQSALDAGEAFHFPPNAPAHVLIIDEINRGNISAILGELITLIEPNRRLGAPGELRLRLSGSARRFALPPNLHLIGTMNTADRSIALLDVALRRRFRFEELMPSPGTLKHILSAQTDDVGFIDLVVDLFETLNARIRALHDRDHQLGHALFFEATGYAGLRRVFLERVIPLLQEYFYSAWPRVCAVLGCPYDHQGQPERTGPTSDGRRYRAPLIRASRFDASLLGVDSVDDEQRLDHVVEPQFAHADLETRTLLRYFLGVLEMDTASERARGLALLEGSAAAAHPVASP